MKVFGNFLQCWEKLPISEEAHFLISREAGDGSSSVRNENGTLAVAPRLAELETERVRAGTGMELGESSSHVNGIQSQGESRAFLDLPDWLYELIKSGCVHFSSQGSSALGLPRIRGPRWWDY